jgi:hypothetical protein
MPHRIVEDALEVEIGDEWDVALKWDDCTSYRNSIHRLGGCKAVDVLAFSRTRREILMLELKDFRGHRIENKDRIRDGSLFMEIGHKVRDTIAGLCGAARRGDDPALLELSSQLSTRIPLTVVLWLEEDARPSGVSRRTSVDSSTMTQLLRTRLRWLTPYALVCSRQGPNLEARGIQIRSLGLSS